MADNAFQALLPNISDSALAAALIRRAVYMVEDGEDTQTIDLQNALMVGFGSNFYRYDSTDTTTPHDGISVLVDINGRRYKIGDIAPVASVLDRTATPPGSPAYGDAYLATAGATGDWAGLDDYVMVYLGAGWRGVAPFVGYAIFVEDEDGYYHYSAAGVWEPGIGSIPLGAASVSPIEEQFWGGLAVEDVLNTPPGSPTDGQAWLVDTSPTGAWVGHTDDVAYYRGGWEYLEPYEGAKIWDRDTDAVLTYSGGAWAAPEEIVPVETEIHDMTGVGTIDVLDLGENVKLDLLFIDFDTANPLIRTSADNGGSFASGASDYWNISTDTASSSMTAAATPATGTRAVAFASINGFNVATIKSTLITSSGTIFQRETAEANNAIQVTRTGGGTWTGGKLLVTKYRG